MQPLYDSLGELKNQEFISIYDPTCGTGSMLIDSTNFLRKR